MSPDKLIELVKKTFRTASELFIEDPRNWENNYDAFVGFQVAIAIQNEQIPKEQSDNFVALCMLQLPHEREDVQMFLAKNTK